MTSGSLPSRDNEPASASPHSDPGRSAVVVTGVGAVTGYGWSTSKFAEGLFGGQTSIAPAKGFAVAGHRTSVVSEVGPAPPELEERLARAGPLSRADRFALAAAWEALAQARLEVESSSPGNSAAESWRDRCGVFFSGSTAGMFEAERYFFSLLSWRDSRAKRPRLRDTRSHTLNAPGDVVARALGVTGPVATVSSACASATLAFGLALDALRSGEVDIAIVGGSDALCQLTYAGFNALRAVDDVPSRPFRAERAGLSLGEGAGVLVLECAEHASGRGALGLAQVCGAGASCDAHHMTAPMSSGAGAAVAVRNALDDAGLEAGDIDFVNAHGTGTPQNDVSEWRAFEEVFDQHAEAMPLTSTKGNIGHLLGAAGAVEAVATVLCLRRGLVHPTCGQGTIDAQIPCDLVVGGSREVGRGLRALSTNLAFGGANAAVILADCSGSDA